MSKRSNSNDSSIGCAMYLLLAVLAMPLVGNICFLPEKMVNKRC